MAVDLGQGLHGISGETSGNLILDVGNMYEGLDLTALEAVGVSQLDNALLTARDMGATRGGASFETGKEIRFLEIDGRRFPIKGLSRIDAYEPSLTIQILEQSDENIEAYLGNYDRTSHTAYVEYELSLVVQTADYLSNVCIVTALSNVDTLIIVALENALAVDSIEFPLEDKSEVVTEVRFVGHALDSAPDDSPFHLYFPQSATS